MEPFYRAELVDTAEEAIEKLIKAGLPRKIAVENVEHSRRCVVWKNDLYQVLIDHSAPHGFGADVVVWYLSIRRLDREPIHDWRHLQQIKNELCGKEVEGFELYPAESRVVDGANQYHMHVIMAPQGFKFPVGFFPKGTARTDVETAAKFGAKQRAF